MLTGIHINNSFNEDIKPENITIKEIFHDEDNPNAFCGLSVEMVEVSKLFGRANTIYTVKKADESHSVSDGHVLYMGLQPFCER